MTSVPAPTALIVDDNFYNRDLCALALNYVGYEVAEAGDGRAALYMLAEKTYSLLILDLEMPELDGLGVLRHIQGQDRHRSMSIIIMTANHHMATEEVAAYVDFIIYKPIDVGEFTHLLRRLVKLPPGE
jgi:CheY-like chemotaxis protein